MKLTHSNANALMKRREVVITLEHASNPGFAHATTLIAQHFKVGEEHVVVRAIRGHFGSHVYLIEAFVYDSAEARSEIEPKAKEKKVAA